MNAPFIKGVIRVLHIHNGDSTANTARQSTIPGEHFAFREALIAGPAPAGLQDDDWRLLRASHLAGAYGVDEHECAHGLLLQDEKLFGWGEHDEVVLWFDHDLFCQVNLIYLLARIAARRAGNPGKTRLSLICIDRFFGLPNFHGLGELNAEQLSSLFETRHEVSAAELELATAAWAAYCSAEPTSIAALIEGDMSALPFLRSALLCHLARFPSVRNGLGRIEQRGLEMVKDGISEFVRLFPRFSDAEPVYGLGDFQFYLALKTLGKSPVPLLTLNQVNANSRLGSGQIRETAFEITAGGQAVLQGEADFVELNGIDSWLGGVHLTGSNLWRWDEHQQKVVRG